MLDRHLKVHNLSCGTKPRGKRGMDVSQAFLFRRYGQSPTKGDVDVRQSVFQEGQGNKGLSLV